MSAHAIADQWFDLVIKRAPELRRAGVLSIGYEGYSVVFAAAEPAAGDDDKADGPAVVEADEPADAWEKPESYPTGTVPSFGKVDAPDELPEIPQFGDD